MRFHLISFTYLCKAFTQKKKQNLCGWIFLCKTKKKIRKCDVNECTTTRKYNLDSVIIIQAIFYFISPYFALLFLFSVTHENQIFPKNYSPIVNHVACCIRNNEKIVKHIKQNEKEQQIRVCVCVCRVGRDGSAQRMNKLKRNNNYKTLLDDLFDIMLNSINVLICGSASSSSSLSSQKKSFDAFLLYMYLYIYYCVCARFRKKKIKSFKSFIILIKSVIYAFHSDAFLSQQVFRASDGTTLTGFFVVSFFQ